MEAIEKIKSAEMLAEENKKDAQKKAEQMILDAKSNGENFVNEKVLSAKKLADEQKKQAEDDAKLKYQQIIEEYNSQTSKNIKLASSNYDKAVSAVISEIFN